MPCEFRAAGPAVLLRNVGVHQAELPGLLEDLLRPRAVAVVVPGDWTDLLFGEVVRHLAQRPLLVGQREIDHGLAPWRICAIDWSVNSSTRVPGKRDGSNHKWTRIGAVQDALPIVIVAVVAVAAVVAVVLLALGKGVFDDIRADDVRPGPEPAHVRDLEIAQMYAAREALRAARGAPPAPPPRDDDLRAEVRALVEARNARRPARGGAPPGGGAHRPPRGPRRPAAGRRGGGRAASFRAGWVACAPCPPFDVSTSTSSRPVRARTSTLKPRSS